MTKEDAERSVLFYYPSSVRKFFIVLYNIKIQKCDYIVAVTLYLNRSAGMLHTLSLRHFIIAAIFVFLCSSFAIAQDETPPFDFPMLEDETPIEAQFEESVTAHLYTFQGSEGDQVSISMTGKLDSYLVLLGDAGQLLAHADEGGEATGDALIEDYELPYDGNYYVVATTFVYLDGIMATDTTLRVPLAYEIVLTGTTALEDLETTITITPLEVGEPFEGELTTEAPIGYFQFSGEDNAAINLVFNFESMASYPMFYLFDAEGNRIAMSPQMDGTSEADLLDFALPEDGDYLVMVMDSFFIDIDEESGSYGIGNFNLALTES
jgi:hypothetical protein